MAQLSLRVYIASLCRNCEEAVRLAHEARELFPEVKVEVINLDQAGERPEEVFSVPTYVLNGRVVSLGNPSTEELRERLAEAMRRDRDVGK